jgi:hypothetical protein
MSSNANYLNMIINGAVRVTFVVKPTMQAGAHLLELALRGLNAGLSILNIKVQMPTAITQAERTAAEGAKDHKGFSYAREFYTKVHNYLPMAITNHNDAFKGLSTGDLVKGAVVYTAVAVTTTFLANKFIGPMPEELYNNVAKYTGSALRLDGKYDVIQMALNRWAARA